MACLRMLFWDQLSESIPTLQQANKEKDILLMCELMQDAKQVKHHKKKLVLLFSAMRHFAEQRRQEGWEVVYIAITQSASEKTWIDHGEDLIQSRKLQRVMLTKPSDFARWQELQAWKKTAKVPVEIAEALRFY